jgi:alkyl hydroperoxide reductase subunit AhpC
VAKLKNEFARRNVKVLTVSVDALDSHHGWIKDINETQACTINFPIIADAERKVSTLYDMIHPKADSTAAVRSVFIIGPDKKIKLVLTYPATTGRNLLRSCAPSNRSYLRPTISWRRRPIGKIVRIALW